MSHSAIVRDFLRFCTLSGGHNQKCAINPQTNRCKASKKADGLCINVNGRCRRAKTSPSTKKNKKSRHNKNKSKNKNHDAALKRFRRLGCKALTIWQRKKGKKLLGKGKYGKAHVVCKGKSKNCEYVMKIQKRGAMFEDEVMALRELQSTGVVPKLFAAFTCKGHGYIVMEKLQKIKWEEGAKEHYLKMQDALAKIHARNWLHLDLHPGNVMKRDNGEHVLIDFGSAIKRRGTSKFQNKDNFILNGRSGVELWKWDELVRSEKLLLADPSRFFLGSTK